MMYITLSIKSKGFKSHNGNLVNHLSRCDEDVVIEVRKESEAKECLVTCT